MGKMFGGGRAARLQMMAQAQQESQMLARQELRDAETRAQMDLDRKASEERLNQIRTDTEAQRVKQEAALEEAKKASAAPDSNSPVLREQTRKKMAAFSERGGRRSTILSGLSSKLGSASDKLGL